MVTFAEGAQLFRSGIKDVTTGLRKFAGEDEEELQRLLAKTELKERVKQTVKQEFQPPSLEKQLNDLYGKLASADEASRVQIQEQINTIMPGFKAINAVKAAYRRDVDVYDEIRPADFSFKKIKSSQLLKGIDPIEMKEDDLRGELTTQKQISDAKTKIAENIRLLLGDLSHTSQQAAYEAALNQMMARGPFAELEEDKDISIPVITQKVPKGFSWRKHPWTPAEEQVDKETIRAITSIQPEARPAKKEKTKAAQRFTNPDQVKEAYQKGSLTGEQAIAILEQQFSGQF